MYSPIRALSRHEKINFLITNRIPRSLMTRLMGWYSNINNPLLTRFSLFVWRQFAKDLDLSESKKQRFKSLHDCFIRELEEGSRPIDEGDNIVVSPCDAIVGACGKINGSTVYQAKGFPYELHDLIPDTGLHQKYRNGYFVTLRLKSCMYHRFHAPLDCEIRHVTYISGDTWNVNPIALKRVEKLFCKNERAVVELKTDHSSSSITLVPVAAILVASMKFHCLNHTLNLRYKGPNLLHCHANYKKGDELGYFQHGSTIILFATREFTLCENVRTGERINMGQSLLVQNQ